MSVIKNSFLLVMSMAVVWFIGCSTPASKNELSFQLQNGDLLFQDLDGNPFCDAVEKVTQGHNGARLTHVGIVAHEKTGVLMVLEAVPQEGVVATSLPIFLARSADVTGNPKVLVGRLKRPYRRLIPMALQEINARLGKPYDPVFDLQNDAYYCSELIYIAFRTANHGTPVFETAPMTFVDPDTQKTFQLWQDYFAELQVPIPEGAPGLNPGGISRSPAISIVHAFGQPDGWHGR